MCVAGVKNPYPLPRWPLRHAIDPAVADVARIGRLVSSTKRTTSSTAPPPWCDESAAPLRRGSSVTGCASAWPPVRAGPTTRPNKRHATPYDASSLSCAVTLAGDEEGGRGGDHCKDVGDDLRRAIGAAVLIVVGDRDIVRLEHAVANVFLWNDWNWAAAEREIQCALQLNPDSVDALIAFEQTRSS